MKFCYYKQNLATGDGVQEHESDWSVYFEGSEGSLLACSEHIGSLFQGQLGCSYVSIYPTRKYLKVSCSTCGDKDTIVTDMFLDCFLDYICNSCRA